MRFKDRQEQSADFKDTKLAKPDSSSADKSQQGVVNQHSYGQLAGQAYANIGAGVAKGISDVKEFKDGYDLAEIRKKRQANIDDLLNADPNRVNEEIVALGVDRKVEEDALSAQASSGDINAPRANAKEEHIFGVPEGVTKDIENAVGMAQANVRAQTAKLARARKQGRISATTFLSRSRQIVKEAIAQNPSLEDEIIQDTRRLWEINGVQDRIDLDKQENAARISTEAKVMTNRIANWDKGNNGPIPKNPDGSINTYTMDRTNAEQAIERQKDDQVRRVNEGNVEQQKLQITEILRKDPTTLESPADLKARQMLGKVVTKGMAGVLEAIASNKPELISQARASYITAINQMKEEFAAEYSEFNDNRITKLIARFDAQAASYALMMDGTLTGKAAAEFSKNQQIVMKNADINALAESLGMNEVEQAHYFKAATLLAQFHDVGNNAEMMVEVVKFLRVSHNKSAKRRKNAVKANPEDYTGLLKGGIPLLEQATKPEATDGDKEVANNIVEADVEAAGSHEVPEIQLAHIRSSVDEYVSPRYFQVARIATPETRANQNLLIDADARISDKNMARDFEIYDNLGYKINITYDENGIRFNQVQGGRNATEVAQLTKKYAKLINRLRPAIGNVNGMDSTNPKITQSILERLPFVANRIKQQEDALNPHEGGSTRADGTPKSKQGFLGVQKNRAGKIVTEREMSFTFAGEKGQQEVSVPLMIPTLTPEEIKIVVNGGDITQAIRDKAMAHAKKRGSQGKSPFFDENTERPTGNAEKKKIPLRTL